MDWKKTVKEYGKPLLIGALGVGLSYGGFRGYTAYYNYAALWQWAIQVDQKVRTLESKGTDMKPGSPLPPGATIEDGEKYGFPKGTKVTIMPPEATKPPAPKKETPKK